MTLPCGTHIHSDPYGRFSIKYPYEWNILPKCNPIYNVCFTSPDFVKNVKGLTTRPTQNGYLITIRFNKGIESLYNSFCNEGSNSCQKVSLGQFVGWKIYKESLRLVLSEIDVSDKIKYQLALLLF